MADIWPGLLPSRSLQRPLASSCGATGPAEAMGCAFFALTAAWGNWGQGEIGVRVKLS